MGVGDRQAGKDGVRDASTLALSCILGRQELGVGERPQTPDSLKGQQGEGIRISYGLGSAPLFSCDPAEGAL